MDGLTLPDGRRILLGERTPGGSKNETRFGTVDGLPLVVKIQHAHGRLRHEERMLRFLADRTIRVPTVIASGSSADGLPFLALSQEPGVRTNTPAGWGRFGRDLAALSGVSTDGCPAPIIDAAGFAADHRQRLAVVASSLDLELVQEIRLAIGRIEEADRLVLTHGDPGSGNYLDRAEGAGVLLDWETASVSPFGLDVGRAAFIGLMDLGHTRLPRELSAAVVAGYLAGLKAAGVSLDPSLLRASITVAGLQFIHGRHTRPLRSDRTAGMAVDALTEYLSEPISEGW